MSRDQTISTPESASKAANPQNPKNSSKSQHNSANCDTLAARLRKERDLAVLKKIELELLSVACWLRAFGGDQG